MAMDICNGCGSVCVDWELGAIMVPMSKALGPQTALGIPTTIELSETITFVRSLN